MCSRVRTLAYYGAATRKPTVVVMLRIVFQAVCIHLYVSPAIPMSPYGEFSKILPSIPLRSPNPLQSPYAFSATYAMQPSKKCNACCCPSIGGLCGDPCYIGEATPLPKPYTPNLGLCAPYIYIYISIHTFISYVYPYNRLRGKP